MHFFSYFYHFYYENRFEMKCISKFKIEQVANSNPGDTNDQSIPHLLHRAAQFCYHAKQCRLRLFAKCVI